MNEKRGSGQNHRSPQAQDAPQVMSKIDENRQKRDEIQNFLVDKKMACFNNPRYFGDYQSQVYIQPKGNLSTLNTDLADLSQDFHGSSPLQSEGVIGPLSMQQILSMKELNHLNVRAELENCSDKSRFYDNFMKKDQE